MDTVTSAGHKGVTWAVVGGRGSSQKVAKRAVLPKWFLQVLSSFSKPEATWKVTSPPREKNHFISLLNKPFSQENILITYRQNGKQCSEA